MRARWWMATAALAVSAPAAAGPWRVSSERTELVDGDRWSVSTLEARLDGEVVSAEVWVYRPAEVERGAALGFAGWNRSPESFITQVDPAPLAERHRAPVAVVAMGPSIYEPSLYPETRPERRWCGEDCTVGGGRYVADAVIPWLVERDGPLSLLFGASTGARGAVSLVQSFPGLSGGIPTVCGMSGAWDLQALDASTGEYRVHAQVLGERDEQAARWAALDPVQHADRLRGQRVLLIHGQDDAVVPWERAAGFAESLEAAGARVELWTVPGGGHDERVWRSGVRACFGAAMTRTPPAVVRRDLAVDVARAVDASAEPGTLEADLGLALADDTLDGARVGLHVQDLQTGRTRYAREADTPINPASVQKLISTFVVLSHLDVSDTLTTTVLRDGELDAEGRLDGDLVIRGGGDPGLVIERMWKLALEVYHAGVREISGDVRVDPSRFGPEAPVPAWPEGIESPDAPPYAAPVSGLAVNYNAHAVRISPAAEAGAPLVVATEVPVDHVEVVVEGRTLPAGSRGRVEVARSVAQGRERVVVTGGLAVGDGPTVEYLNVAEPARYGGALFVSLFESLGGSVKGRVRLEDGDGGAALEVVTRYASLPVGMLLALQNKWSSNPIAEHLLREAARRVLGEGTPEAAVQLVEQTLTAAGLDLTGTRVFNGSGLTRTGRVTARLVTSVLQAASDDPAIGPDLLSSLAVWGEDGTARRYGRDSAHAGRVRVKTGSVNGVRTLAGVVGCEGHPGFAFALLVADAPRSWEVPRVWPAVIDAIGAQCPPLR